MVIDIETLARTPRAVIFEVGMIAFTRATFTEVAHASFPVNIFAQLAAGREFERETIEFHQRQGTLPEALAKDDPQATMTRIHHFILSHNPERIWIQGTDFDRPIIESYFRDFGRPLPWEYWKAADSRTLWSTAFPGVKHDPRPHRALLDARATLKDLFRTLTELNRLESV